METKTQYLPEFLSSVLTPALVATLKQSGHGTSGKQMAFHLYRVLNYVAKASGQFALTFERYAGDEADGEAEEKEAEEKEAEEKEADTHEGSFPTQSLAIQSAGLLRSAEQMTAALTELADALREIYPQLDVHQHELVENLFSYSETRMGTLVELPGISTTAQLRSAVERTKKNHEQIQAAIDHYRGFLAAEFSFRDSLEEATPIHVTPTYVQNRLEKGAITMSEEHFTGNKYNISGGQQGAVGDGARAENFTQTQSPKQALDLKTLAEQLGQIAEAARGQATEPEQQIAIGSLEAAKAAAEKGDEPKALSFLKTAGKWTLGIATDMGAKIAAEVIKAQIGLG